MATKATAPAPALKPRIVRWLWAYGRPPAGATVADAVRYECTPSVHPRCAEPLWRGRSVLASERVVYVGLVYEPGDVTRAWSGDVWSEPDERSGRLRTWRRGRRRGWRDWDAFARDWARERPGHHGEVWLRPDAVPVAMAVATGLDPELYPRAAAIIAEARAVAASVGLPVVEIKELTS